jgi:hypothetical protein
MFNDAPAAGALDSLARVQALVLAPDRPRDPRTERRREEVPY